MSSQTADGKERRTNWDEYYGNPMKVNDLMPVWFLFSRPSLLLQADRKWIFSLSSDRVFCLLPGPLSYNFPLVTAIMQPIYLHYNILSHRVVVKPVLLLKINFRRLLFTVSWVGLPCIYGLSLSELFEISVRRSCSTEISSVDVLNCTSYALSLSCCEYL